MSRHPFAVDQLVELATKPEWGPGRILAVNGAKLTIYFRDLPGDTPAAAVKVIDTSFAQLATWPEASEPQLDKLPPYKDGQFERLPRPRTTIAAAIERFEQEFPLRFEDPLYLQEERNYKWAAHESFASSLAEDRGRNLLAEGDLPELRQRLLAVEGKVNLLASFERMAFRDALGDDRALVLFAGALFDLIDAAAEDRQALERYLRAVESLPAVGNTSPAKWTVATLLPFLAAPERFMFLKPEVTKECAARMMFELGYTTELVPGPYLRLLEMSRILFERLQPLGARDFLDVQSFIWVIGCWGRSPTQSSGKLDNCWTNSSWTHDHD